MVYAIRDGISAKKVFANIVPKVNLSSATYTGNKFEAFWQAYYGDVVVNSQSAAFADLGFEAGTSFVNISNWTAEDTVAAVSGADIGLTTHTSMTADAHIGNGVIVVDSDGNKYYHRVVDNTTGTLTLETTGHSVAATDKILLLDKVPFCVDSTCYNRLDHVATDFSFEPPTSDSTDVYFLGSSNSAGSQNSALDVDNPTKGNVSITMRGGVIDLMKLKNAESTAPTGRTRYNLGATNSVDSALVVLVSTDFDDPSSSDQITMGMLFNDLSILNAGPLSSVTADAKAEMSFEADCTAANIEAEIIDVQHTTNHNA